MAKREGREDIIKMIEDKTRVAPPLTTVRKSENIAEVLVNTDHEMGLINT